MVDRTKRVVLASLLVVGVLAGCSKSSNESSGTFCSSMKTGDSLFAVRNVDGDVDLDALKPRFQKVVDEAPASLQADLKYLSEVVIGYVEVSQHTMTSEELLKQYPEAKINAAKAKLNAYLKPNCGFTV